MLTGPLAWGQFSGLFSPNVPTIDVGELAAAMDSGKPAVDGAKGKKAYLLVDVRDDNEIAVSMIPGAITKADYEENSERYAGYRIIPYCTVGYRSGKYTQTLIKQGSDAVNFEGSIMGWVEAGRPLVTPDGRDTRRVHTWSRKIAAPPGYEQVVE
jgi:rhodanese-related sulfurtransferase